MKYTLFASETDPIRYNKALTKLEAEVTKIEAAIPKEAMYLEGESLIEEIRSGIFTKKSIQRLITLVKKQIVDPLKAKLAVATAFLNFGSWLLEATNNFIAEIKGFLFMDIGKALLKDSTPLTAALETFDESAKLNNA